MNVYSELRSQPTGIHKFSAAKANQRDRLLTIDFILVAGFSMLGLFAAIEPLRRANSLSEKEVFRFRLTSWDGSPVVCAAGFSLPVDAQVDEVDFADITFVCAGVAPESNIPAQLPDHIRKLWRRGKTVGGLCGGTFALAKAGILSGKKFTLHWEHYAVFVSRWPDLEPNRDIYCIDDRIITCAGEIASADMMLGMIYDCCGQIISQNIMDLCLIKSKRHERDEQSSAIASRLGNRSKHLLQAVAWIDENFLTERGVDNFYNAISISARQIQRLFKLYVGKSPLKYMNELRLKHARSLLAETNLSIEDVATVCGFDTSTHFSRSFRERFGITPFRYAHFTKPDARVLALPPPHAAA